MNPHDHPLSDPLALAQQRLRQNAVAVARHNHIPHKQNPLPIHHGHPGSKG